MSKFADNNIIDQINSVTVTGGTETLTIGFARQQRFSGTGNHTLRLPDATTLKNGTSLRVSNDATGDISVQDNGLNVLIAVNVGQYVDLLLIDNGTTNGTWDLQDPSIRPSSDVQGPGASTDNAVTLWDGTGGDTVKDSSLIFSGGTLSGQTTIDMGNMEITSSAISAGDVNGSIGISSSGTGNVTLEGFAYPKTDGTANQVLTTDGAGGFTFQDPAGDVSGTAPSTITSIPVWDDAGATQLRNTDVTIDALNAMTGITELDVDNLNFNDNTIVATDVGGSIVITPDTTGDVILDGQKWPQEIAETGWLLSVTDDTTFQTGWVDPTTITVGGSAQLFARIPFTYSGNVSPSPDVFFDNMLYTPFDDTVDEDVVMQVDVPPNYTPGTQIFLQIRGFCPGAGDIVFNTDTGLYESGVTDSTASPATNRHTASSTVTVAANTHLNDQSLALTDAAGAINGVAVAASDKLTVSFQREGSNVADTAAGDWNNANFYLTF